MQALAPAKIKPIYEALEKNVVDVQKASQNFDRVKLINVLKEGANEVEELLKGMKGTDSRQHQVEILAEIKKLITKFESGKGTFLDLYNDFYLFIERRLQLDV